MPSSYTCLHYHIVFSTKLRESAILPDFRDRLYGYMAGIIRELEGMPLAINGVADHVHILARLTPKEAVADVLRTIKANSSKWLRETFPHVRWPGWQDGYAAFSVSRSQLDAVLAYIARQEEHHAGQGFQDEMRALFRQHEIEFDEQFVWR